VRLNWDSTSLHVRPDSHGCSPFVDCCCLSRGSFALLVASALAQPFLDTTQELLYSFDDELSLVFVIVNSPAFTFVLVFMASSFPFEVCCFAFSVPWSPAEPWRPQPLPPPALRATEAESISIRPSRSSWSSWEPPFLLICCLLFSPLSSASRVPTGSER
jgi:hypothetical protein